VKTIGLLGGMSWESTVPYYRLINQSVAAKLGGFHSARLLLYSVDFHEIELLQQRGAWDEAGELLADASAALERGGAEFLVICTNTMHRVADAIERRVRIPILHIADATADAVRRAGIGRVGLLGTRFTMEQEFYRGRLERHGLRVTVPGAADREIVHRVIYEELCRGALRDESRDEYRRIIADLVRGGVEGVIFGCTEIGLLVGEGDAAVPTFDTTEIHARAAAALAMTVDVT
jgi:aspartate racemase